MLSGYKLQGVEALLSARLYSDLHAGVPAATLFLLHLFYVRISVVCGNMRHYKSWHFKNRIFGDARCSTSSAQVFHPCLPGSHILVGRCASLCKVPPTLGIAFVQKSFASSRAQGLPYGVPRNGRTGCDTGAALANRRQTSLLPGYISSQGS
jgi:hypothetical protein